MRHVSDIMTAVVATVTAETPIAEAADLMFSRQLTGLPVVDDAGRVIGIITEHDFLTRDDHLHIPSYLNFLTALNGDTHNQAKAEIDKIQALTVGDLMTSSVETVSPDDPVALAAQKLTAEHINPLPVVDDSGYLVGVVSRSDIVKLLNNKN